MHLLEQKHMSRMNDTDRQAVPARPPASSSARKKVLIVDDEKDIVDLLVPRRAAERSERRFEVRERVRAEVRTPTK